MRAKYLTTLLPAAFAAMGFAVAPLPALAAPQMMGLVASNAAVPMQCKQGHCFAELTAFCLQPLRASPLRGTAYTLHDASRVIAYATTKDGRRIELNVEKHLQIKAERSHVAVRIGMSAQTMHRLGLRQIHVKVARNATLVPVKGDVLPQYPDEIATAAGALRAIGASYVDREQRWMPVARMANRLINALPDGGRVNEQRRTGLWQDVIGPNDFNGTPAGTQERFRALYDHCQDAVEMIRVPNMRRCLEAKHDSLVGGLNNVYWQAVKSGS
ncbi:MAG: hypothetical protein VCE74_05420 [Alphaproteobacteria bacterium]